MIGINRSEFVAKTKLFSFLLCKIIPVKKQEAQLDREAQVKKKIVGFGSKDIEAAVALKRQLEEQDKAKLQHEANKKRLAELEAKGFDVLSF